MMEKRGFNKKAQQEGIGLGFLLVLIIGAVVVVLLILGFTGGLNFIFDKFKIAPGQNLEAVVQSCKIAAEAGLKADFCATFKKVNLNGKTEYINCQDERVTAALTGVDLPVVTCASENSDIRMQCGRLTAKEYPTVLVNGKLCAQWTNVVAKKCEDLGVKDVSEKLIKAAAWDIDKAACDRLNGQDVTSQVQDNSGKPQNAKVCCLAPVP